MQFRYRFVPYGTRFVAAKGERHARGAHHAERELFENELAADVGGSCWGHDGETLPVLDHHFYRGAGQFPSATSAVLHHAARIRERLGGRHDTVWLVTHRDPDFDAFASLYLARAVIDGSLPADGWEHCGVRPDGWYRRAERDRLVSSQAGEPAGRAALGRPARRGGGPRRQLPPQPVPGRAVAPRRPLRRHPARPRLPCRNERRL